MVTPYSREAHTRKIEFKIFSLGLAYYRFPGTDRFNSRPITIFNLRMCLHIN